jgi:hypothetical protein
MRSCTVNDGQHAANEVQASAPAAEPCWRLAAMNRRSCYLLVATTLSLILCRTASAQEPAPAAAAAPASGTPRLETTSRDWNFGVVWQGTPLEFKVTLTSVGDAPLIIEDVKSSCGCTVPTKPKSPLQPGESDTITVTYAGRTKVGTAHQTVTLVTNDPAQRTVPISVQGEVKPCYALEPRSGLVFGSLLRSSHESRTATIINKFTDKMVLKLKEGQDFGPYEVELKEVEPGMRYEITATTKPPLPSGSLSASVSLSTNFEYIPDFNITVYGFGHEAAAVGRVSRGPAARGDRRALESRHHQGRVPQDQRGRGHGQAGGAVRDYRDLTARRPHSD